MKRILIIDDDHDICRLLSRFLAKNYFDSIAVNNATDAIARLKSEQFELVLCDYKLPDATGIDLLQKIKIFVPSIAVVMITGYSDIKLAVEALRCGAYDYITKPLFPDEILITINNALDNLNPRLRSDKAIDSNTDRQKAYIAGVSPQSKAVQNLIDLIAPTDMTVIISGETGTGKEFVANDIHRKSNRASKPFIAIDCGAIPNDLAGSELFGHIKGAFTGALNDKEGSFESAKGGTLFLDEIGNLSYDNQIRLLRVLQEKKIKKIGSNNDIDIDVRIIAATNDDLKKAVGENQFREDIYHRLNEFQIELLPLRQRLDDIQLFSDYFLKIANQALSKNITGFDEDVKKHMLHYHWHGNLRELRNVIKRAVLLCGKGKIKFEHLPAEIRYPRMFAEPILNGIQASNEQDLKTATTNAEKMVILNALKKAGYNKSKAAKELNIDRKTIYNKIRAFQI